MRRVSFLLILAIVLTVPSICFAWGADSHKITVQIALNYLDAKARAEIKTILGDQTLTDIATWADVVRRPNGNHRATERAATTYGGRFRNDRKGSRFQPAGDPKLLDRRSG